MFQFQSSEQDLSDMLWINFNFALYFIQWLGDLFLLLSW